MKQFITLFFLIIHFFSLNAQVIYRVNADPTVQGANVYRTLMQAHDAANDGDIIYLEANSINNDYSQSYPNYNSIYKRLTIIGSGFDLDKYTNSHFDKREITVGFIFFRRGSAGSRIIGLKASGISVQDKNIIIERCDTGGIGLDQEVFEGVVYRANYTSIINCKVGEISGIGSSVKPIGCTITNNILYYRIYSLSKSTISRNTIKFENSASNGYFEYVDDCVITENIFDARDCDKFYIFGFNWDGGYAANAGNSVSNNLCIRHAGLPVGNGNVNSVASGSVFKITNPWVINPLIISNLELATNSPARTVGPGGTPIGAFSGTTPFVPTLPNIPIITNFDMQAVGNTNNPLQVTVKARSNN